MRVIGIAVVGLLLSAAAPAQAAQSETVVPQTAHAIPNVPGKSLQAVLVEYSPGAASVSHRHAPSAFIYAYVLSGAIRSQVNAGPVRVYRAGESWTEAPGAHHVVSENASASEPASLLAIFVVDSADHQLTIPDGNGGGSR